MGTWGTAGASALEGFRSAADRRRRAVAVRWSALVLCCLFGWLGLAVLHGRSLVVVLSALGATFVAVAMWRPDPDAARWLRGAGGEAATAAVLRQLPGKRWQVFHDLAVPGSRANIDHVVIGRTGVWVIDTKTSRAAVRVGLTAVHLGDRRLNTEPVKWEAQVVSDRLGVRARPLIALHGVGPTGASDGVRLPRRGVRRGGVRIVSGVDVSRRIRRGRRRLARVEVDELADEVLAQFRSASPPARQNGTAPSTRRHGSATAWPTT